jgi:copper chaperone CopZ
LVAAGLWLGSVALRSKEPTYSAPPAGAPAQLSSEVPDGCLVRRFAVEGMCCETCPKKLHAALAAVEGVREAAIDFDAKQASAVVDAGTPVERLLGALTSEKYSARALP